MKRAFTVMTALLLAMTLLAQPAAQTPARAPKQFAREQADRLDSLVQLTPRQYKKVYRFNKRRYDPSQQSVDPSLQEKRYLRILTQEQYRKWSSFEAQLQFRRMIEDPQTQETL